MTKALNLTATDMRHQSQSMPKVVTYAAGGTGPCKDMKPFTGRSANGRRL